MSKKIKVLFTDSDREALQPVLEALRAKGLWVSIALIHTESQAKRYVGFGNDAVVTRDRLTVKSVLEFCP